MKNLLFVIATFWVGNLFANSLAIETSPLSDSIDVRAKILNLYKKEVERSGSPINLAMNEIAQQEGVPELGSLELPTLNDLLLTQTGRSGYDGAAASYLMGIKIARTGSGLIEEHVAYISVNTSFSLENESETVELKKFVNITDKATQ